MRGAPNSCPHNQQSSTSLRTSAIAHAARLLCRLQLSQQLPDALLKSCHTLCLLCRQCLAALQLALTVFQQALELCHLPLSLLKQVAQSCDTPTPLFAAGTQRQAALGVLSQLRP